MGLSWIAAFATAACDQSAMMPPVEAPRDLAVAMPPDLTQVPDMAAPFPAPHPAPPQVIRLPGPVLAKPRIVPVFFAHDDLALEASLGDFHNKIGSSKYWTATTSEYGVGPATATPPVLLTETAEGTIPDAQLAKWLAMKLNSDDPAFPVADEDTVYVLYYPAGTTITFSGVPSCQAFSGYHANTRLDLAHHGINVAYVVVPRCDPTLVTLTETASHEIVEAATDPFPVSKPAFAAVDEDHFYWAYNLGGGEVGDLCENLRDAITSFPDLPYSVQRTWSNAAILAGHNPCVPAPSGFYYAAVPELADSVSLSRSFPLGVTVLPGQSRTIALDLYSDGDIGGKFSVSVQGVNRGGGGDVSYTLDHNEGVNGDKINLTIKVTTASQLGANIFEVVSTGVSGSFSWFGLVGEL